MRIVHRNLAGGGRNRAGGLPAVAEDLDKRIGYDALRGGPEPARVLFAVLASRGPTSCDGDTYSKGRKEQLTTWSSRCGASGLSRQLPLLRGP